MCLTVKALAALITLALSFSASAASDDDLDELIDQATSLSQTAPLEETERLLSRLNAEIDQANQHQRATIRYLQIRLLGLRGRYDESLELATMTLAEPQSNDDALSLHRLAANIAINAGRQELAFEHLHRAIELLKTSDNPFEHAGILGLSSQLQIEAGNSARAVEQALVGLQYAEQVDDDRLRCAAAARAIQALNMHGTPDPALELALPALAICRQSGDAALIGSLLNKLVDAYLQLGRPEPVGPLLDEAEALLANHYHEGALLSRLLAARWLMIEDRPDEALALAEQLAVEFEQLRLWRRLNDTLEIQARSHRLLGDVEASYEARRLQLAARERFLNRERLLSLANAEIGFEALQNQHQLALLREQARVNSLREQAEEGQVRLRVLIAGLGSTVLLLLALLLWHSLRERRHFIELAENDGLTGMPNHTNFFAALDREIQRAHHGGSPLSLVLADIDHFKSINDQHGHQVGDAVLKETARKLRSAFESSGISGRIGGEEFAVLLPGIHAAQARTMVESLRASFSSISSGNPVERVSLSFGVAELKAGESGEDLRGRADQALYAAKGRGRNQVVLA